MPTLITIVTKPKKKYPNGERISIVIADSLTHGETISFLKYQFEDFSHIESVNTVSHIVISSSRI